VMEWNHPGIMMAFISLAVIIAMALIGVIMYVCGRGRRKPQKAGDTHASDDQLPFFGRDDDTETLLHRSTAARSGSPDPYASTNS